MLCYHLKTAICYLLKKAHRTLYATESAVLSTEDSTEFTEDGAELATKNYYVLSTEDRTDTTEDSTESAVLSTEGSASFADFCSS